MAMNHRKMNRKSSMKPGHFHDRWNGGFHDDENKQKVKQDKRTLNRSPYLVSTFGIYSLTSPLSFCVFVFFLPLKYFWIILIFL